MSLWSVALDLKDLDTETSALTVRSGKGNKARIGYASRGAKAALEKWLFLRGDGEGPLLLPVLKSGRIIHRRMTDQAVLSILLKRAKEAGVKHFSPHDLRRTFISDAPLSPTCSMRVLILARCRRWPGTRMSRPPHAMIGVEKWPNKKLLSCSTYLSVDEKWAQDWLHGFSETIYEMPSLRYHQRNS